MRRTSFALLLLLVPAAPLSAQDAAQFFKDNCAACHTIGGAPGPAPDLKDESKRRDHAWLVRFILNPEQTAKMDPAAASLVKQFDGVLMPTPDGLNAQTVEALLRYIDQVSSAGRPRPTAAEAAADARVATAADVISGHELYEGRRAFARGGAACVGCHRLDSIGGLGGGRLGPDLTLADQRLGGARGLSAWLGNPPTKVMRAVFRDRALTDNERFAVVALLANTAPRAAGLDRSRTARFLGAGAAAASFVLLVMGIAWSRRLRGVRRPLVDAARRVRGAAR